LPESIEHAFLVIILVGTEAAAPIQLEPVRPALSPHQ
jgi:hypothetical protein